MCFAANANLARTFGVALWAAILAVFVSAGPAPAQGAKSAAAPIRILALGDSLMQGYGLPPGQDFPARLEAKLKAKGHNVVITNAGVSGDTSAGGLAVLEWSLAGPLPDAAIVELGGNDALRGIAPAETEKNLDAMLARLKAKNIPVLFAGMMAPRNLGPDYVKAFDAIYPKLAKRYGAVFYPFFLDGVALDKALLQPDGIHPNVKGVDVIVERITPAAEKLLAEAKAASTP